MNCMLINNITIASNSFLAFFFVLHSWKEVVIEKIKFLLA